MTYFEFKEKAIFLRRDGRSYSEILKQVPVAKSTLSLWLRSVGLSKRQKQRLTEKKIDSMRRGWLKVHRMRVEKTLRIRNRARKEVQDLIGDPLWLTGTILYWAEGGKEKIWRPSERVSFTNMDLDAVRIFIRWVEKYLNIKPQRLIYELLIHENADIEGAKKFWQKNLNLEDNVLRVYLKHHRLKPSRKNIAAAYHGVIKIRILKSTDILRKIAGWIEGVVEYLR